MIRTTRGAALITAMLIAALAAAVVATLAAGQSQWLRTVELRRDQVQAQAIVLAALTWSRQVLRDDARAGPYDTLSEPWALPLPPVPVENGSVEGRIVDAQGLINVNNLATDGTFATTERKRLARLFAAAGVPAAAIDALADYVDADDTARDGGTESAAYDSIKPSRAPANRPLVRVAEAMLARGVDANRFATVAPHLVALPSMTALNVNTASPEVLASAVNGLEGDALASLVADRARKPFTTAADFRARLPSGASIDDAATFAVRSDYFLVTVKARQGETIARGRALLNRRNDDTPRVVWQTIE
ncbi:MAG TPA: type II secretion system minor pseudopilin GspK [Casimicrobiaceae bacterium]|nr:type II secretion system minor pseudopilin GspK [Casimicrobiaceae bacterium]